MATTKSYLLRIELKNNVYSQVCTPSSNWNIIELQAAQDNNYKIFPEISD